MTKEIVASVIVGMMCEDHSNSNVFDFWGFRLLFFKIIHKGRIYILCC